MSGSPPSSPSAMLYSLAADVNIAQRLSEVHASLAWPELYAAPMLVEAGATELPSTQEDREFQIMCSNFWRAYAVNSVTRYHNFANLCKGAYRQHIQMGEEEEEQKKQGRVFKCAKRKLA